MKILIVSYYFPPYNNVGAIRVGKIAKHLAEFGHEVRVLSADDQPYPETLLCEIPHTDRIGTKWFDFNHIINRFTGNRQKLLAEIYHQGSQKKSLRRRLISMLAGLYRWIVYTPDAQIGWYPYAVKTGRAMIHDFHPDVIFASASPYTSLLIAKSLSDEFTIPWIADLRDLWADNHYAKGGWFARFLEKRTLDSARFITSVSADLCQTLQKKYGDKVILMQNGIDYEDTQKATAFHFPDGLFHIVYTGILYGDKRDPSPLFDAIKESPLLKEKVRVHFYGKNLHYAVELARAAQLQFVVHTYSEVSRAQVLNLQKGADLLLLLTWNDASNPGVLTGKLFEYIASGTEILAVGYHDHAAKIVVDHDLGYSSNDSTEIRKFLEYRIDNKREKHPTDQQLFDRKRETRKLEQVICSLPKLH